MPLDAQNFGPIETVDQWRAFVAAFDDRTLPQSLWTHRAHLTVGLWYVLHHGPVAALELLRVGIRQYNTAVGVANTDSAGYHETLTRFYVMALDDFVSRSGERGPTPSLLTRLAACESLLDSSWPLMFYTREHILSVEARRNWVEPDVAPLPFDNKL